MERRPIYLSLILWFLVLWATGCFLTLAWNYTLLKKTTIDAALTDEIFLGTRVPIIERFILNEVCFVLFIVTAKFMLDGENWARSVYVGWIILWLGFCGYKSWNIIQVLPNAFFHAAVIVLIFLPPANRYFVPDYKRFSAV